MRLCPACNGNNWRTCIPYCWSESGLHVRTSSRSALRVNFSVRIKCLSCERRENPRTTVRLGSSSRPAWNNSISCHLVENDLQFKLIEVYFVVDWWFWIYYLFAEKLFNVDEHVLNPMFWKLSKTSPNKCLASCFGPVFFVEIDLNDENFPKIMLNISLMRES